VSTSPWLGHPPLLNAALNQPVLVRHALLSLTSLHMAYLQPTEAEKFEAHAARHQSQALPLFRQGLANVTESNCHALYACGHLIAKYTFARPQSRERLLFSSDIGAVPEIMSMLRGAFSIHNYARQWLLDGPLGFSLKEPLEAEPDLAINPDDSHLERLLAFLLVQDGEEACICCGALNALRRLFAMAATPQQTVSTKTIAYTWPMQVSERFILLIRHKNPLALIVLAQYSVILKRIDNLWFMEGVGLGILRQCQQNLDRSWDRFLEWPMSVVDTR
jgi:hypothetical protein